MAVPPFFLAIYEAFVGIFTGAASITVLALLALFVAKFIFDILTDWLFKGLKKYLNILFFPGSWFHMLWHSLAIRVLGYDIRVSFHMSMTLRDVSSQSLSGDLKNVWHALLIGIAPLMNIVIVVLLIHFHQDFRNFFDWINFPLGKWLIIYLIICFCFFALPDFADLLLPFTTATAKHAELIFLFLFGSFSFIIAIGVWGYFIPLINYILFCVALIYLAEKEVFNRKAKPIKKGFEPVKKEKTQESSFEL